MRALPIVPRKGRYGVAVDRGAKAGVVLCDMGLWHIFGRPDRATYKALCIRAAAELGDSAIMQSARGL